MARHRDVRNMDYSDDYDGYDDVYGHSVDDDYFISPSNKAFLYNRENSHSLSNEQGIIEEDENLPEEAKLSDLDKAKLESALEEIRKILGSTNFTRNDIVQAILQNDFSIEKSTNALLQKKNDSTLNFKDKIVEKVIQQPTPQKSTPVKEVEPPKIIEAGKNTTNITKGFDVGFKNIPIGASLGVSLTPRSQSPASGRGTPVFAPQTAPLSNVEGGFSGDEFKCIRKRDNKEAEELYKKERLNDKEHLYMVVIGHVDAGKSTLMGHLLCALGQVNQKTMHKYEQESRKLGKQSFMYAWVLDETGEERNRGITMDVGRYQFETPTKKVTLLDAPGHKDFIPNMISGATQADVALLVVDATRGEFETGFDFGGQTREHALLVRSLGVSQLAVAINKLDTVSWSKERFDHIVDKLKSFLKQAGFRENDVTFVPCSGLTGQNMIAKPTENELLVWYNGQCLLEVIDGFRPPQRPVAKPFRLSINDVFKGVGSNFCISGRVETGTITIGDKVLICPNREFATVKSVALEELPQNIVFAGDQATVTLSGIEMQNVSVGNIICDPIFPVPVASKFEARIVVFNVKVPITKGFSVVLHHQSLVEPAVITKLISQLNKSSGDLLKKHPRFLGNNTSAIVEISLSKPIGLELYSECKELGRVMLRIGGVTIAAGLINKIIL